MGEYGKLEKLVLNIPGFDEVRRSPEVMAFLESTAKSVASAAGSDFVAKTYRKRGAVIVLPKNSRGRRKNLKENTLVKAAKGGKG